MVERSQKRKKNVKYMHEVFTAQKHNAWKIIRNR